MTELIPLRQVDSADVDTLLDQAFGTDRRARTAYRLREGTTAIESLSFAVIDSHGALVGSLQSWPVALRSDSDIVYPMMLVGPVAVRPARQRSGIGKALMERLIDHADRSGADPMIMIGDPEYYGFFGFSAQRTMQWRVCGPVDRHRLLARIPDTHVLPPSGEIIPDTRL